MERVRHTRRRKAHCVSAIPLIRNCCSSEGSTQWKCCSSEEKHILVVRSQGIPQRRITQQTPHKGFIGKGTRRELPLARWGVSKDWVVRRVSWAGELPRVRTGGISSPELGARPRTWWDFARRDWWISQLRYWWTFKPGNVLWLLTLCSPVHQSQSFKINNFQRIGRQYCAHR